MGKKRRFNRQHTSDGPEVKRGNPAWQDIKKDSDKFVAYYQSQQLVTEAEWPEFMEYCRKDLPSTFRITGVRGHALDLLRCLKEGYLSHISDEEKAIREDPDFKSRVDGWEESEENLSMEAINWYPNEMAWNSNLSRRFIRRSEILQKLHRFLVEDSECGAITRQEAVSMIPPMLLDVKPHHLVLDTCAAPGSKTAQIIEMMHSDRDVVPSGMVVANDADHKRCYLLVHQAKRLNSPCVVITNHDAACYPKLFSQNQSTGKQEVVRFDRVLCDVPCSGDGTLRKNPAIWSKWHAGLGAGLHLLQKRIAVRGLELTKVGGRLVYSTCSFNPIENEAVIATILQKTEGTVELVDCSAQIPQLKRRPGLKTWKVYNHKKDHWASSTEELTGKFRELQSMFPPSKEVADNIHLERCMRIYPQLQNTGGFFIAVLEKKAPLPWQQNSSAKEELSALCNGRMPWEKKIVDEETDSQVKKSSTSVMETKIEEQVDIDKEDNHINQTSDPAPKKFKRGMIKEDPYFFLDDEDADIKDLRLRYGISRELPTNQFLVRCNEGKKRHIYLVSESVHRIMSQNMSSLKVVNTGVRVVARSSFKAGAQESGCEYRLVQDGINIMHRYIKHRLIDITYEDMVTLLLAMDTGDVPKEQLSSETVQRLEHQEMGCVVWKFTPVSGDKSALSSPLWLCGHHGNKVVQCMLSKEERRHFLRLLRIPLPEPASNGVESKQTDLKPEDDEVRKDKKTDCSDGEE